MEPSDAKSIAESLIQQYAKDVPRHRGADAAFDLGLSLNEALAISDEVVGLIENAKITVEFEENR